MTNEQAEEWAATTAHEESEEREEASRHPTPWAPHMTCACQNPGAAECVRSRCGLDRSGWDDYSSAENPCDHCDCECECACHEPGDDDDDGA